MQRNAPKYSMIVDHLLAKIENGTYNIGDPLPTEHRLMRAFGVSRHTIRNALENLKRMGVIESIQGKGTIVVDHASKVGFVERIQSIETLLAMGTNLRREILSTKTIAADENLATDFGVQPGVELLEFHLLRYDESSDENPTAYIKLWVHPIYRQITEIIPKDARTTAELLSAHFGREIGSLRQIVSAGCLDADIARHLHRPVGHYALQIQRSYAENSIGPVHLRTFSICPGDLLQIESHFRSS